MTKYIAICFLCLSYLMANAQQIWKPLDENQVPHQIQQVKTMQSTKAALYELDFESMVSTLATAQAQDEAVRIKVPNERGYLVAYTVKKREFMAPELAVKYPELSSYVGKSDDGDALAYFNLGIKGFHGSIKFRDRTVYIDPYTSASTKYYSVYDTRYTIKDSNTINSCGFDPTELVDTETYPKEINMPTDLSKDPSEPVIQRVYRFALACTGEWGERQGTLAAAMDAINTGVTRLNQITEPELAITLELVANNDQLLHLDPDTDPYSDGAGFTILGENTQVISNIIGINNFDIGHVWSRCFDTGGVANPSGVCTNIKGNGVTCITSAVINQNVISTMAHEVGHQFSAGHTWSNCPPAAAQLAPATAVEPGSGVTLMSYNGLCGPANNTGLADIDLYHVATLEQMSFFSRIGAGDGCAEKISTTNNTPEVSISVGNGVTIPISTAFELTGEAFDPDGDEMLYTWEQVDALSGSTLGEPMGDAPAFINISPSDDKTRLFPRLSTLLGGSATKTEVLATYTRNYTFRFVARDQHPSGFGGVDWEEIEFSTTEDAGPFKIVYPNSAETLVIGSTTEVTWDVANTDQPPVNCEFVNIYLSTDGGITYPYLLAKNSPNTGSADVIIPNDPSFQARIKVKAADNIFFDISNFGNTVAAPTSASFMIDIPEICYQLCLPELLNIDLGTAGFAGFDTPIDLSIKSGLPQNAVATFSANQVSPGQSSTLTLDLNNVSESGIYELVIEGNAGGQSYQRTILLDMTSNDFSQLATVGPAADQTGVSLTPTFTWVDIPDASSYNIEVATSPTFGASTIISIDNYEGTSLNSPELLDLSSVYFWRIQAVNECGNSPYSTVQGFSTEVLSCQTVDAIDSNQPINISPTGTPDVDITFPITSMGQVSKISIPQIQGLHENTGDLEFRLISPINTEVLLIDNECNFSSNFNIGFDDGSNLSEIACPLTISNTYKPIEALSSFNGEEISGFWTFRVSDNRVSNGGAVRNLTIEICSNLPLAPPILINNNRLEVPTGQRNKIVSDLLLTTDENNSPDEIIYYVVSLPENGILTNGANVLSLGASFLQSDIDNGQIRYEHDGTDTSSDSFRFTAEDGAGGWIGIEVYDIAIDESFTSSVEDADLNTNINIYPNPTTDLLNIEQLDVFNQSFRLKLFNHQGQLILDQDMNGTLNTIDVSNLSNGVYEVLLSDTNNEIRQSFVKIK